MTELKVTLRVECDDPVSLFTEHRTVRLSNGIPECFVWSKYLEDMIFEIQTIDADADSDTETVTWPHFGAKSSQ